MRPPRATRTEAPTTRSRAMIFLATASRSAAEPPLGWSGLTWLDWAKPATNASTEASRAVLRKLMARDYTAENQSAADERRKTQMIARWVRPETVNSALETRCD